MPEATHLDIHWFRFGKSHVGARPALPLVEDMADLTDYFRNLFRKSPEAMNCNVELEGFAPVVVRFRALCQTVGLLLLPPHTAKDKQPDAVCLLVNGLEDATDIAVVKEKVKFPPHVWAQLDRAAKPVVIAGFNVNGRMRDPATTTVIHVISNVYFNSFGTNAIGKAGPSGE